MAGSGWTKPSGHKGHATDGIWDKCAEGRETADQTDHGIRPSAWAMHGQLKIASQRTVDVGTNVERARSAGTDQKYKVLVAQIRQGHGVSSRSVPHAPPLFHTVPTGGTTVIWSTNNFLKSRSRWWRRIAGGTYLGIARDPRQGRSPHWDWTRIFEGTWKNRKR